MKRFDLVGGFIWLILGIGVCIGSIELGLGVLQKPGPGFLPFLSGVLLGLFGLIIIFPLILRNLRKEKELNAKKVWGKENWKSLFPTLLAFLALFGYLLFLNILGFILTAFLFLFFLFKLKEPKKWVMPLILSGVTVILSYLLFSVWLMCQFPKGIFGF